MRWSEQQQAVLAAMGLRVWAPPRPQDSTAGPVAVGAPDGSPAAVPAALPRVDRTLPASAGPRPAAPQPTAVPVPAPAPPVPASTSAAAGTDWSSLRAAVSGCRACGLCEGRIQAIVGAGNAPARYFVVGEAPGEEEDLAGSPLVGAAGLLLDRMLAALCLTRSVDGVEPWRRAHVAPAIRCRPPASRIPRPDEWVSCEPHLLREIGLVGPSVILALGRPVAQALLRSEEPLGRLRGRVHRYAGVPLVVTFHPAYLLRNPFEKSRAWEDLCLAAGVAERAPGNDGGQAGADGRRPAIDCLER